MAAAAHAERSAARVQQKRLATNALLAVFRRYIGVPTVVGREHIPAGPFLICANHRSHLDSLALICALEIRCGFALLGARDYFFEGGPMRRLLATPFTVISVERRTPSVAMLGTIRAAAAFFRNGGRVLIAYPEGSRQTVPGIAPFKRGVATLALALRLPVLPVFISGTERLLGKGHIIPLRGRIVVRLGPPIAPEPQLHCVNRRLRSRRLIAEIESDVHKLADAGD
jgi:1-acyl-sn-glycerol-3-phosphate acyltransferase